MVSELPGYRYDEATKRYFKLTPAELAAARQLVSRPSGSMRNKRSKVASLAVAPPLQQQHQQHPYRRVFEQMWNAASERRIGYRHDIEGLAIGKYRPTRSMQPDCLPIDDSITAIAFDDEPTRRPRIIIGCSSGSIATGYLEGNSVDYPNDEHSWRIGWYLASSVTSLLTTPGGRILATCLGLPAQAVIGTTNENISSASVTLSPRKTSLWTSALSESIVALGCDRKVLLSTDPTRSSLLSYVTGSRHGDGAVYALDLTENLIFAGTRSGNVKIFDKRSSGSSDSNGGAEVETRAEINVMIDSPVTHLRRIQSGLLIAGLNGSLDVFDLRFVPRPFLRLPHHVNSYTRDLGFDVWKDDFVAAAGQDHRVRLWSLRSGKQILSGSEASFLNRVFEAPVKAIRFREGGGDRDDEGARVGGQRSSDELWIANGAALGCYAID